MGRQESPCMCRKAASSPPSAPPTAVGLEKMMWMRSRASLEVGLCIFFAGEIEDCCGSGLRGKMECYCVEIEKLFQLKSCSFVKSSVSCSAAARLI